MVNCIKNFYTHVESYFLLILSFIPLNFQAVYDNVFNRYNQNEIIDYSRQICIIFYFLSILAISYCLANYRINKIFVLKIPLFYFGYSVLSYLFNVTLNINNPKFNALNFRENGFLQTNVILPIVLILALSSLTKLISAQNKILSKLPRIATPFDFENYFLSQFLVCLLFHDKLFLTLLPRIQLIKVISGRLPEQVFTEQHLWLFIGLVFLISFFASVISFSIVKGISDLVQNKSTGSLAFISCIFFASIFNHTIQLSLGIGDPHFGTFIFQGALSFQFIVLFSLFTFCYLVFNRYLIATLLIIIFGSFFSYANSLKVNMRGEPILPSDLSWLLKPATLLGFTDGNILIYSFVIILFFSFILYRIRKKLFSGQIIKNFNLRLVLVSLCLSPFFIFFSIFEKQNDNKISANIPVLSVLYNSEYVGWMGNLKHARYKSLSFVWFNQLSTPAMTLPKNYSKEKIREIEKKYRKLREEINKDRSEYLQEHTIIYVLSESFSDPSRMEGVTLSHNPLERIQEIKNQTTSGLMKSDGYGGGTANMEFQSLTSLPFYNLSPSLSVVYTELVPRMPFIPNISDSFSNSDRIAIHLASSSNYSRQSIYEKFGYRKFISIDTKGISVVNEGSYPSDQSTYKLVLDNIDTTKSQFFSVITMQNHSIWQEPEPSNLVASMEGGDNSQNDLLTSYARLLTHTDKATKDFLDELSKIDKKITVVFYGDHLPGLYNQTVIENNAVRQYQTDYFIWSNHETKKLNYPLVNSSDFNAILFEQTDSKVSSYYALMTEVLHKASVDKDREKLDAEAKEIVEDLKLVEYDLIGGKGYLSKDFFKLPAK